MTRQQQIEKILEVFDFEKVRAYMASTDWEWGSDKGEEEIPSVDILKSTARRLLEECVDYTSTGGLHVIEIYGELDLLFCIEHSYFKMKNFDE